MTKVIESAPPATEASANQEQPPLHADEAMIVPISEIIGVNGSLHQAIQRLKARRAAKP